MGYKVKPSILEVNLLYLVLGLLLLTLGVYVQAREVYSGLLITEYIFILLPSLLFLKIKDAPIRQVLRLNRIGLKQVIIAILIAIFAYPIAVFFQAIVLAVIGLFREVTPSSVPMPYDGMQYIISFFIIALSPGICEEVLFRGVILSSYERIGYRKSIIISALLFGIFHFNLLNFIGPTILGLIFGIMVYRTNSIFPSIIGHTINNTIALTIGYLFNRYHLEIEEITSDYSSEMVYSGGSEFILFIFLIICIWVVRSLLNSLEPVDLVEDFKDMGHEMEYMDSREIFSDIPMRIKSIEYTPVIIMILIFILRSWIYLFM